MAISQSLSSIADLDKGQIPQKNSHDILVYTFMGYPIFVGRNASSNDTLVSEHQHKDCLWFHVTSGKGAHVVLCVSGREDPAEIVLRRAAAFALQNSKGSDSQVLYAPLADVYRPQKSNPGVFMTWRTTSIAL